jgi:hypothetical protein
MDSWIELLASAFLILAGVVVLVVAIGVRAL